MKYISIKSVLHDLSSLIPEDMWNDNYLYEWAIKGVRKLNLSPMLVDKVCLATLAEHKATLPEDMHSISQIGFRLNTTSNEDITEYLQEIMGLTEDDPSTSHMANPLGLVEQVSQYLSGSTNWLPMYESSSPMAKGITITDDLYYNPEYRYEYVVNPDNTITSTLKEGVLLIGYKAHPCDKGEYLIPDDEDVKDAITHFCLYRFYAARAIVHEEGARQERDYYLQRFDTLAKKAKSVNLPTLSQLESMSNQVNRLKRNTSHFDHFFSNLGYKENTTL